MPDQRLEIQDQTVSNNRSHLLQAKRRLIISFCLGLAVLGSALGYWYWTRTPEYSLKCVSEAIRTHDLDLFEKHVDLDSLVPRAVDQIISDKSPGINDATNPTVKAMVQNFIKMVKPQLVQSAKDQIKSYVEKGSFDKPQPAQAQGSNTNRQNNRQINVGDVYSNTGGGGPQYKGTDYTRIDGKIAAVGIKFYYPKLESDALLEVKMRERGGYWQVTEFSNLSEFMKKLDELEKAKLAKLNAPSKAEMDQALIFPRVRIKKDYTDRWRLNKIAEFQIEYKNRSQKAILETTAQLQMEDYMYGNILLNKPIVAPAAEMPIPAGQTRTFYYKWDINEFVDSDKAFWSTPVENMKYKIMIKSIKFDDGTKLELLDKLP